LIEPDHRSAAALDGAVEAGKTPIVTQAIFNSLLEKIARALGGHLDVRIVEGKWNA
jgi:hypothetical protein